jgi:hypothetical protein
MNRNQTRIQTPRPASQRAKDHQLNKSVPVIRFEYTSLCWAQV